jgi:hypothetical protein
VKEVMNVDRKIIERLVELIELGKQALSSREKGYSKGEFSFSYDRINEEITHRWGVSCLSLLNRVFGKDSDHYIQFDKLFSEFAKPQNVLKAYGILQSAKDDYEKDFLFETRVLIQAEVFDDFLEQSKHLLDVGYYGSAAVIAGSVLEDGLRKLCTNKGVVLSAKPKLDSMNSALAKASAYNLLTQKRITALADLRNKAAHGKWDEFNKSDVDQMISQVRAFMEDHFR